eukprot:TRINITY_DN20191_c0_g1_i1.p1 TRINITY_DN20191_c0_g1~~TRINITY_DN20191_c0_g1_i1.p1  ORF type:complete len:637 (+),score=37.27 TRINITY_DN20191_c0_g1_i1:136-2046(+)
MRVLSRSTFALLLASVSCQPTGDPRCPCLSTNRPGIERYLNASDDGGWCVFATMGLTSCFPTDIGANGCEAYEAYAEPVCADANGTALANRPTWCSDAWCWVDKSKCEHFKDAIPSTMFPDSGLYYSYATCGNPQTFAKWDISTVQSARQLKGSVEGYMQRVRTEVEEHVLEEDHHAEGHGICTGITHACECETCNLSQAWTSQSISGEKQFLDFRRSNFVAETDRFNNENDVQMNEDRCVASLIADTMQQIALRTYNDPNRVAYMYYGSQQTGSMVQWPAYEICFEGFDSRMRPWYATAAAGPKDLVIVLDRSGSTNKNSRWPVVKDAAKKVLHTLAVADFVSVVTFATEAAVYDGEHGANLHRVMTSTRNNITAWINSQEALGGTNFRAGLQLAGEALAAGKASGRTSGCASMVIFLTDGVDSEGFKASEVKDIPGLKDAVLLTYSFGTGIGDQQLVKKLACQNSGIWHEVPDGGDIASIMSNYYMPLAASMNSPRARWLTYKDMGTGTDLVSACCPIYDSSAEVRLLNGVACMDLNVVIDLPTFSWKEDYNRAWYEMLNSATTCSTGNISDAHLDFFRRKHPAGGACKACDMDDSDCPTMVVVARASGQAVWRWRLAATIMFVTGPALLAPAW